MRFGRRGDNMRLVIVRDIFEVIYNMLFTFKFVVVNDFSVKII